VATGLVLRVRTFNGNTTTNNWRFTKVYENSGDQWKVVSVHASEAKVPE
jgi:hypothetical protein